MFREKQPPVPRSVAGAAAAGSPGQVGNRPASAPPARLLAARCVKVPVCRTEKSCGPLCCSVCGDELTFNKSCFSPGQCARIKGCVMVHGCGALVFKHKRCAKVCRQVCQTRLHCKTQVICR
ncbi:MAG: hypothetical protein KJ621_20605 [Proteobacteria bacterium]|nr:hypothetical protein [Pseudomonadota bacterium]MBU1742562.1 hypothetical protein [Pseudomonadota bacterium]